MTERSIPPMREPLTDPSYFPILPDLDPPDHAAIPLRGEIPHQAPLFCSIKDWAIPGDGGDVGAMSGFDRLLVVGEERADVCPSLLWPFFGQQQGLRHAAPSTIAPVFASRTALAHHRSRFPLE
ncbi:MAG: hypothetical protein WC541_07505 [Dehalococcoidia bacterium]